MNTYAVGELYSAKTTSWPEVAQYNFRGGEHELVLFLKQPTKREVREITQGQPVEFGLLVEGSVILLLYKFGREPWSDAPYSWHLVRAARPEEAVAPVEPVELERVLLHVVLVDATTGIIHGLRAVTLPPAMSRALHAAIRDQMAAPWDAAVFDRTLKRLYTKTSDQLAARAMRGRGGVD